MRDDCDQFEHWWIADLFKLKGWISTKLLAELRQVSEFNGACSTDQQDLVCLALSALPLSRRGAHLTRENYWGS
jgi:hypothetical protein